MQLDLFHDTPFTLRVTIEDAMRIFVDNYWRHLPFGKKSKAYIQKILVFFKGHYLDTISKADVERMRRHLKESGYSDSTINKAHMILSRLYTKWDEYKEGRFLNGTDLSRVVLPAKNPAGQVPRVKEKPRLMLVSKVMKEHLCHVAETLMMDKDLSEIIDMLWWSQQRQGDVFKMTDKNVDLHNRTICGTQNKLITTRNPSGHPYKVMIPADRFPMIKRRVESTPSGKPIFKDTNLQKRWGELRRLAKMTNIQMRDFRGGSTSELLDENTDLETLRRKVGWVNYDMIKVYDKRPDERILRAAEKLVEV